MAALAGDGLPPGWARATLGDLIEGIEAGKNVAAIGRPPGENETGIVKVSAVTWGEFDEEESKALPPDIEIDPRHLIRPGDFLISRANTIELVGAPVIVKQCQSVCNLAPGSACNFDPLDWVMARAGLIAAEP
jgi:type I restriction enzyme S subunit